jgi:hypothetical protein
MFLLPRFGRSNLRRVTDLAIDSQLFHQVQKPGHRPGRFDSYMHRSRQRRIKVPHIAAAVRQGPLRHLSCGGVQHRQRLLASVQITSYNSHLGLLRSEHCWGEHRTVYSDRSEAGVVMTSTGEVGFNTQMSGYPTTQELRLFPAHTEPIYPFITLIAN